MLADATRVKSGFGVDRVWIVTDEANAKHSAAMFRPVTMRVSFGLCGIKHLGRTTEGFYDTALNEANDV
ncbi:hypothetical protein RESH_05055 [Rhodopirellula europaea SH398]|uniref:Uncharacterized protein n=1 Tax=Rhodopirellula europaea SH398 TaxID=1263868 RepID=M5RYT3_9BACT|nr:hypothetical protein RESH_05055 [Rhodopirellula europaea SH398]